MRTSGTAKILFLLATVLGIIGREVQAEEAAPSEMERVCRNWLSYVVRQTGSWAGETDPKITAVEEIVEDGTLLARCYSISPRGHVIVPLLKELPPVKACSEAHPFDGDRRSGYPLLIREVLLHRTKLFIEKYGSIDASQPETGEVLFDRNNRKEWDHLVFGLKHNSGGRLTQAGPLLTSAWHQDNPFNGFCPPGKGGKPHCPTGCLATAVAQIMRYYEWPPRGQGDYTYWWPGDGSVPGKWLHADFFDPYDWEHMPDHDYECTTQEKKDAVAELNYEVGVAFEMYYGAYGSAPNPNPKYVDWLNQVLHMIPEHFRYDPSIDVEYRNQYTAETWFELVQGEVDLGHPMLYYIQTLSGSAHSIVCDGWRDTGGINQYHINYGDGGNPYTGWYTIDQIHNTNDPQKEHLVRNIFPAGPLWIHWDGSMDYTSIQEGIDKIDELRSACGKVNVKNLLAAPGTYTENIDFLGNAVRVRSDVDGDPVTVDPSPSTTFIDGGQAGPVVRIDNCTESFPTIEGFTITNGNGGGNGGGGIYCGFCSSARIKYNIVTGNGTASSGGGVHCEAIGNLLMEDNTISNNLSAAEGGGVCFGADANVNATNNMVTGNISASHGGGVYCAASSFPVIMGNSIRDNRSSHGNGGGIYSEAPTSVISNNVISKNIVGHTSGLGGGIALFSSHPTMINNFVADNTAAGASGMGGGVACFSSSPKIRNNTIAGNSAAQGGGGVYAYSSTPEIMNAVVFGNHANVGPNLHAEGGGGLIVTYSDIENGWIGAGNIDEDPRFIDPQNGDYNLTPGSPCINMGSGGGYMGTVDMGACEYTGIHSLEADVFGLSQGSGGAVHFTLNGGQANNGRNYMVIGSVTGKVPGIKLPGGNRILYVNWDFFTQVVICLANTPVFMDFAGTLDSGGGAYAKFDTLGPLPGMAGVTLTFAYVIQGPPWDFTSNPIDVKVNP